MNYLMVNVTDGAGQRNYIFKWSLRYNLTNNGTITIKFIISSNSLVQVSVLPGIILTSDVGGTRSISFEYGRYVINAVGNGAWDLIGSPVSGYQFQLLFFSK